MLSAFRSAPPARQLAMIAAAVALLCVLLATLYFLFFRTRYETLYTNLRDADAATIVAELDRTHADYRLSDGGHTILVPAGSVDTTRVHVAGQDLPTQGTVGFELFNNSSIGLTEFAQRINLQRALQGELARTIMSIDGVESARVHLSLGEQSLFRGDRRPARASVAIRMQASRRLTGGAVRGVQRLVAGAVPELEPANVAVLNDRGVLISADTPDEAPAAPGTEEERSVEHFFEDRIRHALDGRISADAAEVNVWAAVPQGGAALLSGGAPNEAALTGNRSFRLRATVAVTAPLGDAAHDALTRTVRGAIGYDEALGDEVSVTVTPPLAAPADLSDAEAAIPAGEGANMSMAAQPHSQAWSPTSLWLPLLILALAGAALVAARRSGTGPRPMSERDRLAYVEKLRSLLATRGADVAA